ncbi:MAG: hypothetical protein GXX91_02545 [Verrucomicrobiaceae bacterium]|nr:hypothetical protein [Verrucomicrobiaceae bacterium]
MKKITLTLLTGLALLPCVFPNPLAGQVRETPVTLGLVQGGNPQGYIQGSNEQGILFATASGGAGQLMPYARLRGEGLDKLIRYEERTEVLGTPRALFAAGKYEEAAAAFGKVATDYAILYAAPQNFASEALFYQMESLRRAGQYGSLAELVKRPGAATIDRVLVDSYKRPYALIRLWALFGAGDTAGLKEALAGYQEPVTGPTELLPAPNFKKMPANEMAQVAFLRANVHESDGAGDKALEDYYRSFTLANGNDVRLSKLAMEAAMRIQKEDPLLAAGNGKALIRMQSIAFVFTQRFGKDALPAEFQEFAVRPDVPRPARHPAPAPEGEAAPQSEEKGKDAPKGEAKPKEEAPAAKAK